MDTVLMIGYHNLRTGEHLAGFAGWWTFTNQKDVLVGCHSLGITVLVANHYDKDGEVSVGLAPRLIPEWKDWWLEI